MYVQTSREMITDLLGSAEHTLGTTGVNRFIQSRGFKVSDHDMEKEFSQKETHIFRWIKLKTAISWHWLQNIISDMKKIDMLVWNIYSQLNSYDGPLISNHRLSARSVQTPHLCCCHHHNHHHHQAENKTSISLGLPGDHSPGLKQLHCEIDHNLSLLQYSMCGILPPLLHISLCRPGTLYSSTHS